MTEKPNPQNLKVSVDWIVEREAIRSKREQGLPPPWTKNELIANARWCNVRRMDDRVSQWLLHRWYQNCGGLKGREIVVAAALARLINLPETLERLYPEGFTGFDYRRMHKVLSGMRERGEKIFTGVYIINGANAGGRKKWELVLDNVRTMYGQLSSEDVDNSSMQATHRNLMRFEGMGSFIAGQVVADLRHVYHGTWADRGVWAPQGPGSTKGLNFVFDTPGQNVNTALFLERLGTYIAAVNKYAAVRRIHEDRGLEAHDYQNCLCETSKMARLLSGGRAKNGYNPEKATQLSLI